MKRNNKSGKYTSDNGRIKTVRLWLIGAIAVCLVLLVLMIVFLLQSDRNVENSETILPTGETVQEEIFTLETTEAVGKTSEPVPSETTEPAQETESTEDTEPEQTTQKETQPPKTNTGKNNSQTSNNKPSTNQSSPQATIPPVTQPQKIVIELPYTIPGTSLVIQKIGSYDGVYLEDGANADTSGVAMILLKNTGSEAVEYAEIAMVYDDKTLNFTASAIPAGGQAVVQAKDKAGCAAGDLTLCTADVATRAELEMSSSQVSVVDNGNNSLTVTNLTEQDIVTVRVFYKYYMAEESTYVGGITYTAKISNLKAGESLTINPTHYSSDGSTVVMVRTYDIDA